MVVKIVQHKSIFDFSHFDSFRFLDIRTANKIENMTLESYQIMKQHEKIVNKKCSTKKPKKKKRR